LVTGIAAGIVLVIIVVVVVIVNTRQSKRASSARLRSDTVSEKSEEFSNPLYTGARINPKATELPLDKEEYQPQMEF
jgi:hypothetical protein